VLRISSFVPPSLVWINAFLTQVGRRPFQNWRMADRMKNKRRFISLKYPRAAEGSQKGGASIEATMATHEVTMVILTRSSGKGGAEAH